jgi:Permuted papain-like amidase enzyme, YaeF/YiiX, C92 family
VKGEKMLSPIDRRAFIIFAAGGVSSVASVDRIKAQGSQTKPTGPNPETFESGDLVWPKKPGVFVPYLDESVTVSKANERQIAEDEKQIWLREKTEFIARARNKQTATWFTSEQLDALEKMSFEEFYARYVGGQEPGLLGVYPKGAVYVGHVGVILVDEKNVPWVIEALLHRGVVKSRYEDWRKSRPEEDVWLGRVENLRPDQRHLIATESEKYIGRRYDFWNFDLNDDSGFYCSKLVWLSIWRSLQFAIDGDKNPKRIFWFSPKQLLYSKRMGHLFYPGPYNH